MGSGHAAPFRRLQFCPMIADVRGDASIFFSEEKLERLAASHAFAVEADTTLSLQVRRESMAPERETPVILG